MQTVQLRISGFMKKKDMNRKLFKLSRIWVGIEVMSPFTETPENAVL